MIEVIILTINLLILALLGWLAYDDWKTRSVEVAGIVLLMILGIGAFYISFTYNLFTFNDYIVIGLVSLLTTILILTKQMAHGDIGIIAVAVAMPYLTAIALLFYSILVLIAHFKGNKTSPFYTVFFIALIFALIFQPLALSNPHVCELKGRYIDDYSFEGQYCVNPFLIVSGEQVYEIPKDYTQENNIFPVV